MDELALFGLCAVGGGGVGEPSGFVSHEYAMPWMLLRRDVGDSSGVEGRLGKSCRDNGCEARWERF